MTHELYKKYRPRSFKEMVGQEQAVSVLQGMVAKRRIPHAILFTGPSGTGKTTSARILCDGLECSEHDLSEINCADFRGIDMVREIRSRMGLAPLGGKARIWVIDEAGKLSNDAQNAFLKMLEDTPKHVYFFLCTTDPQKLLPTIKTRCTEIRMQPVTGKKLEGLVTTIVEKEGKTLSEEVIERIVEVADGSPRKALVLLDSIMDLEDEEEQLNAILSNDTKKAGIEIARALVNPRARWDEVRKLLGVVEEEAETVRRIVLGYARGGFAWQQERPPPTGLFNYLCL